MVAIRVIPCLDVNAGRVVKGTNFVDLRDAGNPVEIAKMYNIEGADEIIFAEKESAKSNARKIMSSNFLEFFEISKNVCVVSLRPKKEWIGKSLKELRLREKHKINVITMNIPNKQQQIIVSNAKNFYVRHVQHHISTQIPNTIYFL